MEYFTEFGYLGLFLASFLAATILPLSSEVILCILLLNSFNPALSVTVATFGNVLGALTNYVIGYYGSMIVVQNFLNISEDDFNKALYRFKKYGVTSLFFAWLPVIGDPLTVAAGILRIKISLFLVLVTVGKLLRYLIVSYLILQW